MLDKGRIAEFDTPYNLIQKEGGSRCRFSVMLHVVDFLFFCLVFREMCIQSGTFTELEAAAKAHPKAQGYI